MYDVTKDDIKRNTPRARAFARSHGRAYAGDDLESAGLEALAACAKGFDTARAGAWLSYSNKALAWAYADEMRRLVGRTDNVRRLKNTVSLEALIEAGFDV